MTEDEIVGWHHQLNGHEFKQALGIGKEQGTLACCSPWGGRSEEHTSELQSHRFISYAVFGFGCFRMMKVFL